MNTDNPARSPRRWPDFRRPSAPVVLNPPPAWLSEVPTGLLREHKRPAAEAGLLGWLRAREIYARPTLAQIEAERARRGLRRGVVVSTEDGPAPARMVLPMPPEYRSPEEHLAEARGNRARIEAALGDLSGDPVGVYAIGFEVANAARDEERAA